MTVGEKIRRLRESLGLTQAEFAKAIGDFSKQTISRWEKPNSSVPYSAQKKILQAFNLSTFQLLDDDLIIPSNLTVTMNEFKELWMITRNYQPNRK